MINSLGEAETGLDAEAIQFVAGFNLTMGLIGLIIGGLAWSAASSPQAQDLGLALDGAIAASVLFYPMGIVAVILVAMDHQEFGRQPAPFARAYPAAAVLNGLSLYSPCHCEAAPGGLWLIAVDCNLLLHVSLRGAALGGRRSNPVLSHLSPHKWSLLLLLARLRREKKARSPPRRTRDVRVCAGETVP
jgi:hypothetical protein